MEPQPGADREPQPVTLSVVVATLGRPDPLRRALTSLRAARPGPDEVLVVDGDEQGAARPVVEEQGLLADFPVRHVRAPRGLTRQRNAGLRAAAGDVVLFLDDDARVGPDVLGAVRAAYADAAVVGCTGRVVEPASNALGGKSSRVRRLLFGAQQGSFTTFGYPRRLIDEAADRDVEFMQGAFLSTRRGLGLQVGFDEALPGYGLAEDEDFSWRLSRHGRLRYLGSAVVEHDNAGFGGRDRKAFSRQVVTHRLYLFRKNFPQTRAARARFVLLLALLVGHRLLNRDLVGAAGIVRTALDRQVWRDPLGSLRPAGTR